MRSSKCIGCGIKTYQENGICVLCEKGISQVYEELVDLLKKDKEWDLFRTLLMVEVDQEIFPDRRRHFRYDFPFTTVEYVLSPASNSGIFIGFVFNISGSGLCLKTPKRLKEGQNLIIKSLLFTSSKRATVRWVQQLDNIYYKIGLEFY